MKWQTPEELAKTIKDPRTRELVLQRLHFMDAHATSLHRECVKQGRAGMLLALRQMKTWVLLKGPKTPAGDILYEIELRIDKLKEMLK
jgi:hypothetical protein